MEYRASVEIASSPAQVWAVLTDGARWPEWEPNVTKVEGTLVDGGRFTVHTSLSDQAFPVSVGLEAPREMVWTGGLPLGLFRGVRRFTVEPRGEGCMVVVHEVFSGPLLFLMRRVMPDLQPSFDAFVVALKERAEA